MAWDDPALKQPAFLKLNPAGTIPTIDDDGFVLSESLAINLYLAKTYGPGRQDSLYPGTVQGEADTWRWSLWAQGHIEPWVQRDAALNALRVTAWDQMAALTRAPLTHLNQVLSERAWLVGDHFTVADLNVCAVLSPSRAQHFDLAPYPALRGWLDRAYARPAAVETRRRFQA